MADEKIADMKREMFEVAYDGAALKSHTMDVDMLAPALMGIGNLIREANYQINQDNAKVKISVSSGFEHGCFQITFELVQTIFAQMKSLIGDDNVKSAKDILEWLELSIEFGGLPVSGLVGLFTWLKMRRGRPVQVIRRIEDHDQTGDINVRIEGEAKDVTINKNVYLLGENPRALDAVTRALYPLQHEGVDQFQTRIAGKLTHVISRADADDIFQSCTRDYLPAEEISYEPQKVMALLHVYSPVYDPRATKWRFWYGREHHYMDISETTIAQDAVARGGANINDLYRVILEITQYETKNGEIRNEYKILRVLDFRPAERQLDLIDQIRRSEENDGEG